MQPTPTSTRVTFPAGGLGGTGRVVQVAALPEGRRGVVVDETPFHPVDHTWPDQPADRGTLDGRPVVDVLTGAIGPDGALAVAGDITARRGDTDHAWVVVHVVDGDAPQPGAEVELEVDGAYRDRLSAAHTACHLAALALNAETAPLWTKDADRVDSLGHADLDATAITDSKVRELEAYDAYRFGKSLRKRGFDGATVSARGDRLQDAVNERLAAWLATGAPVRIETGGDATLTARRRWVCELPDGVATLPCGGTHVDSLTRLATVRVSYSVADDGTGLEVVTTVVAA